MAKVFSLLIVWLAVLFLFSSSCATTKRQYQRLGKSIAQDMRRSPVFNRSLTGFVLLDPETGTLLANENGDHYFTPASNTKIFTLATCLALLGDSLPGMECRIRDSVLTFRGVGDPTFLHPEFQAWQPVYNMLRAWDGPLFYDPYHYEEAPFGPGWAWDDMPANYSAPRSPFPYYGNTLRINATPEGTTTAPLPIKPFRIPERQAAQIIPGDNPFFLSEDGVLYTRMDSFVSGFEEEVAFPRSPNALSWDLPFDVLPRAASLAGPQSGAWSVMYSVPVDTVYRRMMHQSDNFIAEQLLLVCAATKFGVLRQDTMIDWVLDSLLSDLPQRPRWVDGSGLSRYNLFSPIDVAIVLQKLWKEQSHDRLLDLFPAGGRDGTLENWYRGTGGQPYVYAKSGSMSGVQCLSGYLIKRNGKVLIFSFMHNNFVGGGSLWKQEMERILQGLHRN
ncbi:MAG: D-alanyl-D-alanine carboxypeptidase [Lewinellaceae bacterium]|nr:D-alanyl-D-alanine carboxypeptidase [Lewinellaceae bacterium]